LVVQRVAQLDEKMVGLWGMRLAVAKVVMLVELMGAMMVDRLGVMSVDRKVEQMAEPWAYEWVDSSADSKES
jgi:hypothetical protein